MREENPRVADDGWIVVGTLPQLRSLLPVGEEPALAWIDDFVAGRIPEGDPHLSGVRDFFDRLVRHENDVEEPYRKHERGSGGEPAASPHPS
jgi:hypothetical protein